MTKLKYGSIAIGMPGSIARRRAEIEDMMACAQRWLDRSNKYGSDMESSQISCLNDALDVLRHTQLEPLSEAYNVIDSATTLSDAARFLKGKPSRE